MRKNQVSHQLVQHYVRPSVEVLTVAVEEGFSTSNNQEPSPWEDMFYFPYEH
jgi:hypothetical protein